MERYYQQEIECASREKIIEIQNEKLVKQVLEPAPVRVIAERKDQAAYDDLTL